MREADATIRQYIQDDIAELSVELQKQELVLQRLSNDQNGNQQISRDVAEVQKRLLSFSDFAKGATAEMLVTLIQSLIERIYITTEDGVRKCHVIIKGCSAEDYSDILGAADYISVYTIWRLHG